MSVSWRGCIQGPEVANIAKRSALRLHPPLYANSRVALRDTVLPTGGGKDGKSSILVYVNTTVAFHVVALHRRQDLWGEDAEEFKPERWASEKGGYV